MKRILTKMTIILAIISTSMSANAGIRCVGKVTNAYSDFQGYVYITGTWRNDITLMCSLKVVWKGVDPIACRTWVATVMTAMAKPLNVDLYYTDPAAIACGSLGTYSDAPSPYWVMLLGS